MPWFPQLARLGLDCARGEFGHCEGDRSKCERHKRTFLGVDWPTCPVRAAMDDPGVEAILRLDRHAQVAPLSGWPERYAAWVPERLAAFRLEREAARQQREREANL